MAKVDSEIIDTRITDHWGVDWNAMEIVRDFLQNFYDANPIEDIKIKINKRTVVVSAPVEFDYKSLIYLGSDKGKDDIGQYGEGFKAALVNAMRNHGCNVKAHIKDILLEFYFEDDMIGEVNKKIIMCKKSKTTVITGSRLMLENCSQEIVDEFKFGLNYFYYESNPLFGELLTKHYSNDIMFFKSIRKDVGYVFYKKLLRAKLDVPLVVVCNRTYKSVDEKIKHDRDRKAFDESVLNKLLTHILKQVTISIIVETLKPWWEKGHKILRYASNSRGYYCSPAGSVEFPDNFFAGHSKRDIPNHYMQLEVDAVEREFKEKGYVQCPAYMANLGMKNATSIIREKEVRQKKKHKTIFTRKPTDLEGSALNVLKEYIRKIDPFLTSRFSTASYTIGESEEIIGELKRERSYRSEDVFLAKTFFYLDFAHALAILLHEWGHIFGFDGSRRFTDALTEFLTAVIKERDGLDAVEEEWNEISVKIRAEREDVDSFSRMENVIEKLTHKQKTQLLKSIPEEEFLKLLEKEDIDI